MSTTTATITQPSAEAAASQTIDNWRLLKKGGEDFSKDALDVLQSPRPTWSEQSFQDALKLYNDFIECRDSYVAGPIEAALNHLDHAYRLYGPESVILSFNGGKDAVVILHLVRAAHAHYYATTSKKKGPVIRPRVIYFDGGDDEFPEIVDFLHSSVDSLDLDMIAFEQGVKFPEGLQLLVDNNRLSSEQPPFPMAFVLGTRSGDPNAGQQGYFAPSSHYMPPFMRVNPILDWTYGHVWHFLRHFHLPYCSLYDQGYTSLGSVKNTLPCPALAVPGTGDSASVPKYWPAYMLRDWDQERAGRISKKKKKKPAAAASPPSGEQQQDEATNSSLTERLSSLSLTRANALNASDTKLAGADDEVSSMSDCSSEVQKSVGILIIGDEILKGFTPDTNTNAAAKALRDQNVLLKRVVVVSDDQQEISTEIRRLRDQVDVIITSGGVGPTHDDVTMKGIAQALNCEMVLNEEMADFLLEKMSNSTAATSLSEAQIKMATLPSISNLRYLSENANDWPVLQCGPCFVLPGIPEFFATKIESVASYLSCQLERSKAYKVVLSVDEHSIVPLLNQVVQNHPSVSIGSYPFVSHPEYKTVITVEGRLATNPKRKNSFVLDKAMIENPKHELDKCVQLALDDLIQNLPAGSVLRVEND